MTTLTKIFIVLHVVLSLMLAAGLIVFVNRTEEFKTTMASQTLKLNAANTEAHNAQQEASHQAADATAARAARDVANADAQLKLAAIQKEKDSLQTQLAEANSRATIKQIESDNVSQALLASETARTALAAVLETTRNDGNTLAKKNSDLNLAVADLTNRNEVLTRQVTNLNESLAESKMACEHAQKVATEHGWSLSTEPGLTLAAPSINGVIVSTQPQAGIPYATISVGSQDQVKRGMKFMIVDREKGNFLGELTVEQVDEKEATGRLEGPKLSDIQLGKTEVKTQL